MQILGSHLRTHHIMFLANPSLSCSPAGTRTRGEGADSSPQEAGTGPMQSVPNFLLRGWWRARPQPAPTPLTSRQRALTPPCVCCQPSQYSSLESVNSSDLHACFSSQRTREACCPLPQWMPSRHASLGQCWQAEAQHLSEWKCAWGSHSSLQGLGYLAWTQLCQDILE